MAVWPKFYTKTSHTFIIIAIAKEWIIAKHLFLSKHGESEDYYPNSLESGHVLIHCSVLHEK